MKWIVIAVVVLAVAALLVLAVMRLLAGSPGRFAAKPVSAADAEAFLSGGTAVKFDLHRTVKASPAAVSEILAGTSGAEPWVPLADRVTVTSGSGAGSVRETRIILASGTERVLVSDGSRLVATVERASIPLVGSIVHELVVTPSGSDSDVRWRVALAPSFPLSLAAKLAKPLIGVALTSALSALDRKV